MTRSAMTDAELRDAHGQCIRNRETIIRSAACGCIYCCEVFEPWEIESWTDSGETAMCPKCGMDAVVGAASGWALTDQFLEAMHARWFGHD